MEDDKSTPVAATIVVVDDDERIRELIRATLEDECYRVLEASDSKTLLSLLEKNEVDLVTLDVGLSGESGLDLIKQVRESSDVGVIMITGKSELIDTVVGLELGADDYIAKPFELRELIARVRSVLRRYEHARAKALPEKSMSEASGTTDAFVFGPWHLELAAERLHDDTGKPCALTNTEFELLHLFVENPHRVLSRDEIMVSLKGREWNPTDRVVDNLVLQLRRKLEHDTSATVIETVRGKGYRFSTNVERLSAN